MGSASPVAKLFPSSAFSFSDHEPLMAFSWIGMAMLTGFIVYSVSWGQTPSVGSIPTVSSTEPIPLQVKDIVEKGYSQYKSGLFRLSQLGQWHIVVSGRKHVDELAKAPDDFLSFSVGVEERMFTKYFSGPTIMANPYHIDLIRANLTRGLSTFFTDVRREAVLAFDDNIPVTDEWASVEVYPAITKTVARISNNIFVGAPACHNPEYLDICIKYTSDVIKGRDTVMKFPEFLREVAARFLTNVPKATSRAQKHLGPIILERQKLINEYGINYPGKPNDFLSWLMDAAEGDERSVEKLTNRVLSLNFAAIHTTSSSFMHALLHLASEPKYLAPLREEVEAVVKEDGWSKVSMTKMYKLDSFLKESQRINSGATTMTRKVLKDFKFSDGTFVPKGTFIAAASMPTHLDEELYPNPHVFDGFRFSDLRDKEGKRITNQFASTNLDYIAFGHAKHACPGRFFAANELKVMLAHIVLTYDVKVEVDGVRPPNQWQGFSCSPDRSGRVMFRRRQT